MDSKIDINDASPPTLDHVIGQRRAVKQLRIALDAHFNDRATAGDQIALPHLLLVGPPGVGKSMLSQLLARELASKLYEELAQNLISPGQLHGLLMMLENSDVLFIDELHELLPQCQTTLYRCLEERRLFLGGDRKTITLPAFTFVGATTDEWALSKPLRDRFKVVIRLEHYSYEELTALIMQRSKRLRWPINEAAVQGIASRGRGTPRLAVRLLDAARRQARSEAEDTITQEHLTRMLEIEGIDTLGLNPTERRYLELLREAQGAVRLNVIATQLSLPRRTIESVIESELIRLGLISKSDDGRMLTALGAKHLTES